MTEVTDRKKQREIIAAGGWTILWGDLINEADIIELFISIPIGAVGAWVSQQVEVQLKKFNQSLKDVSDDVVNQATDYLKNLLRKKKSGESEFGGLGVKAGITTYHRWLKLGSAKTKIPNNHQPYIGLRVKNRLPPIGTVVPSIAPFQQFGLHTGTALHLTDETFAFAMADWDGDGRPDLVAIKKSSTGTGSTEVHILSS
ncbi:hypothetical protein ACHAO7_010152 [Fusarium culmorum]